MNFFTKIFLSAATLVTFATPYRVNAQIISPMNAGMNSGNNSLGSSNSSIGTPNFSEGWASPTIWRLRLEGDGSMYVSAEQFAAIKSAICSASFEIACPTSQEQASATADSANTKGSILIDQLVTSGMSASTATKLITYMTDLSNQTNLRQLSDAINLFNKIVSQSNTEVLSALTKDSVFISISTTLRSTRAAFIN
jgi:hypothetical protein